MAKIRGVPPTGRATRRPGRFLATVTRGGNFTAKAWPRKRGSIKSEAQRETAESFRLAQQAANEAIPWAYIEAENMATGTIWNRREILVKAAQGTLLEIYLDNGEFYGNWFQLAREIQALLDTISDQTGAVLLRGSDGWRAMLPAAAGYVLTSNGPDFEPSYQPGSAPADTWQWSNCQPDAAFTGSDICVGCDYWPAIDIEINAIGFRCGIYAGSTYLMTIAELLSNNRIASIIHAQDVTTAVFAADGRPVIPLSQTVDFDQGKRYGVFISRPNASPGAGLGLFQSRQLTTPIPVNSLSLIVRGSYQVPVVNDLMSTTGNVAFFNMEWRKR